MPSSNGGERTPGTASIADLFEPSKRTAHHHHAVTVAQPEESVTQTPTVTTSAVLRPPERKRKDYARGTPLMAIYTLEAHPSAYHMYLTASNAAGVVVTEELRGCTAHDKNGGDGNGE